MQSWTYLLVIKFKFEPIIVCQFSFIIYLLFIEKINKFNYLIILNFKK